jgi:hypothetical protein
MAIRELKGTLALGIVIEFEDPITWCLHYGENRSKLGLFEHRKYFVLQNCTNLE